MNPKIICFSGASGSGKTTCINKVEEALKQSGHTVCVITENIREIVDDIDQARLNPTIYFNIQKRIIQEKIDTELKISSCGIFDFYLVDRALSDSIFYYSFFVDEKNLSSLDKDSYYKFFNYLNENMENNFKEIYNLVVSFSPLPFIIKLDDPLRPSGINMSRGIEFLFIDSINASRDNYMPYSAFDDKDCFRLTNKILSL